jgi:putative two-component system response regulator
MFDFTQNKESHKIIVVDDDPAQRMLLRMFLEGDGYEVCEAEDGAAAYRLIEKDPSLRMVVTDLDMPLSNGFELIGKIRDGEIHYTYIIVLTSMDDESSLVKALSLGADDYLAKPVRPNELRLRIKGGIRVLKQETQEDLILALAKLSEYRSEETGYHLERVQHYTRLLAFDLSERYPEFGMTTQFAEEIARVSPLHDIGKVAIPDNILHKLGKLTDAEFTIMKTHATIGGQILKDVYDKSGMVYLKIAYEIAMFHHEKYNGKGYPHALKGRDIPIAARIMTLADIYDAMASKRCYKDSFPHEKIKSIIIAERGEHLDPLIVDSFLRKEKDWLEIRDQYGDKE